MKITDVIRDRPGGLPLAGIAVSVKRKRDGLTLATPVTDANGEFTYEVNGSPGAIVYEAAVAAGSSKKHSSVSVGPAGPLQLAEVDRILRSFSDGVVEGVESAMAVVPATGLNVTVGTGSALVRGRIHTQYATVGVVIPAPDATNPRIDLIILRATVSGVDDGMTEVARLAGTPAATPGPPTVTQNTTIWEIPLGQVRVNPGASTIVAGDITDVRPYTGTRIRPGTVTRAMRKGVGRYPNYDSSLLYAPDEFSGTGAAATLNADTIYFVRHTARNAATLNRMQFEVMTALAGGLARVGVYAANSVDGRGLPLTRLVDGDTASLATAGPRLISGLAVPLTEETTHWLAIVFSGSVSIRCQSVAEFTHFQGSDGGSAHVPIQGYFLTSIGAATSGLPASLSGALGQINSSAPLVFAGVA